MPPALCCAAASAPPKNKVDEWARDFEGIKGRNLYGLDHKFWFKGPLHLVLRGFETNLVKIATYFHAKAKMDELNQHWKEVLGLKIQAFEYEGKIVIKMQGNEMRRALDAGAKLVDPAALDEPLLYDDETWIDSEIAELFSALLEAWKRVDVTLRGTAFGNEAGTEPGTFTHGLQTFLDDANLICEISLLLGSLTMTLRSLRDIVPCYLVLAVRLGFAYGLFGEDNNESRHHDQHTLTGRATPGGRAGSTKRERSEKCLKFIIVMEKIVARWNETELFESLVRALGTMQTLEKKGFNPLARFPTWRHADLNKFGLFGELPDPLTKTLALETNEPGAQDGSPQRPAMQTPAASPNVRRSPGWDQIVAGNTRSPHATSTVTSSDGYGLDANSQQLPESEDVDAAGGSLEPSQNPTETEGERGGGDEGLPDTGSDDGDNDGEGEEVQLIRPEEDEAEEEQALQMAAGGLAEEGGDDGATWRSAQSRSQPPPPMVELHRLHEVQLGGSLYDAGGKKEVKVVWSHKKIKVQCELGARGLHRLHMPFSHVCSLGRLPTNDEAASDEVKLLSIAFALCKMPELAVWDPNKASPLLGT